MIDYYVININYKYFKINSSIFLKELSYTFFPTTNI
jgi:hypothetical protein